jgi:release factor glutamine methyltransferase
LIPRPETECLVEKALAFLPEALDGRTPRILELGVGSGAVSIALAAERPHCRLIAIDASPQALRVAAFNAKRHVPQAALTLLAGDWFGPLAPARGQFDLIVSNPPYIPSAEIARLAPEIHRYEPRDALDGDRDGLSAIRQIVHQSPGYLADDGMLLLEIGADQAEAVTAVAQHCGQFHTVQISQDYSGYDRVAALQKKQ